MKDKNMIRLGVFLLFTFVVTWSLEFLLYTKGGFDNPYATLAFMGFLFIPGIACLFTRKFTNEGFQGLGIHPHIQGNLRWYAFAWLGTIVAIYGGCAMYFLCNPSVFDAGMEYYTDVYMKLYDATVATYSREEIYEALKGQLITGAFLMPLFSFPKSLVMELGFRGYMMPKLLERYSTTAAMLIGGVIWGVWFAPMILMGWMFGVDYPLFPLGGLLAIIWFCIVVGIIATYLFIKTKSCIPGAILFATVEGYGTIGIYFCDRNINELNPFVGPTAFGLLGGAGLLCMAVFCLWRSACDAKKLEAQAAEAERTAVRTSTTRRQVYIQKKK